MDERKARLAALRAKAGRKSQEQQQEHQPEKKDDDGDIVMSGEGGGVNVINDNNKQTENEDPPMSKRIRTNKEVGTATTTSVQTKSALEVALENARKEVVSQQGITTESKRREEQSKEMDTNMLSGMAPKKINWDLKRDIEPKLNKLEKRTQKAIVALLKERLEREAEEAAAEEKEADDEDDLD